MKIGKYKRITLILVLPFISSCGLMRLFNSGTANIKYTVTQAKIGNVTYENKNRLRDVSFSIRNVQHPKNHGKWNFNAKISPSIHLDKITFQTGHYQRNSDGVLEQMPNIKYRRLAGLGNIKFTSHTPIGAFALSFGFGGAVYKLYDGKGLDTTKTREIRRIDFVWYGFMSKHFFLLAGPRYYNDGIEQYVFAFRLGYYWGR